MSALTSNTNPITALDIAIIGGGSAGISLAAKLDNLTAAVVEPKTAAERDCSWALWANQDQLQVLAGSIKGRWKQWRLVDHDREIVHHSNHYHYASLSSAAYITACEQNLADGVDLIRATAEDIVAIGNGGCFSAGGKHYQATQLYDSRPPAMLDNSLRQHFLGWDIRTKTALANPETATLMDFRVDQSRGLHFIYALPFSDRRLLIESTMISTKLEDKDWYRQAINQWLQQQNIEIDKTLGEEAGVIPMHSPSPLNNDIAKIGAASGAVRLSSGYAFSTIQKQTALLAERIRSGQYQVPTPIAKPIMRMDEIFNRVLVAQPQLGVAMMMGTAKALDADGFARFMLGSANWLDWAKVIMAMPKIPFLKQVFKS